MLVSLGQFVNFCLSGGILGKYKSQNLRCCQPIPAFVLINECQKSFNKTAYFIMHTFTYKIVYIDFLSCKTIFHITCLKIYTSILGLGIFFSLEQLQKRSCIVVMDIPTTSTISQLAITVNIFIYYQIFIIQFIS